ncbi:MAG TPA: response regulator [Elusimicrobiota bacterium]|nr:response regulator [Elusimicrobiota bacterium]
MRILIIEDDPDVRDTTSVAVESMFPDANITLLADGLEFLEVFERIPNWDLVIMDLMLPGLSGLEICKKIRSQPEGVKIPIVAMTGYDTPETKERIQAAGATAYLPKPFEIQELKDVIRQIFPN